ncbi:hypothetical protein K7472_08110 [Streptomyces sp. PTM05]|uniref:Uncharacterized protein n=1 Tax=Streptantibioticus parmotrematis TaxID=2873249 RepID=A0ABS7QQ69_9ACTN|nr:hypothetical protein [Streptantibioticus parmotrematis]MBY8884809.1 hypothetical protein [Streptantibioticus parmotrematis]
MTHTHPEPAGYLVVAEPVFGGPSAPVRGRLLHASADCAQGELRELTIDLARGGGYVLLGRHLDMPVGVAITRDGVMWAAEIHPATEVHLEFSHP